MTFVSRSSAKEANVDFVKFFTLIFYTKRTTLDISHGKTDLLKAYSRKVAPFHMQTSILPVRSGMEVSLETSHRKKGCATICGIGPINWGNSPQCLIE